MSLKEAFLLWLCFSAFAWSIALVVYFLPELSEKPFWYLGLFGTLLAMFGIGALLLAQRDR